MRFSLSAVFALFVVLAIGLVAIRWFGAAGCAAVVGSSLATLCVFALGAWSSQRPLAGVAVMLFGFLGGIITVTAYDPPKPAPVEVVGVSIVIPAAIWLWFLFAGWSARVSPRSLEQVSVYGTVALELLLVSALVPAAAAAIGWRWIDFTKPGDWLALLQACAVPVDISLFMSAIYGAAWAMGKTLLRRRTVSGDAA